MTFKQLQIEVAEWGRHNFPNAESADPLLSALNGLNLAAEVETAWDSVSQRDWIKFPKDGKTE